MSNTGEEGAGRMEWMGVTSSLFVKTLSLLKKGLEVSEVKSFGNNQMNLIELQSFLWQHRHLLVNLMYCLNWFMYCYTVMFCVFYFRFKLYCLFSQ